MRESCAEGENFAESEFADRLTLLEPLVEVRIPIFCETLESRERSQFVLARSVKAAPGLLERSGQAFRLRASRWFRATDDQQVSEME